MIGSGFTCAGPNGVQMDPDRIREGKPRIELSWMG
jgi:hypothetical protein